MVRMLFRIVTCAISLWMFSRWALPAEGDGPPPVHRLLRVAPEALDRFQGGASLDSAEWMQVLRWMVVLNETRGAPEHLEAYAAGALTPTAYAALVEPDTRSAGQVYTISGWVTLVARLENPLPDPRHLTPAEQDIKAALPTIYVCRVEPRDHPGPVLLLTASVPKSWQVGQSVRYPIETVGIFLKVLPGDMFDEGHSPTAAPCFLVRHIAWRPDTPLGRLGMDVALLENVYVQPLRDTDGRRLPLDVAKMRLTERDTDGFYALLAAVQRASASELRAWAESIAEEDLSNGTSVEPLFNHPQRQQGRLVHLAGHVRRATPVRITDPAVRQRLGADVYYQLYLYTDDSQGNPLVVCVPEVPAGMPLGDGPGYGEPVRVAAFFFKTWAYRIEVASEGDPPWRLAPLLIGQVIDWTPAATPHATGITVRPLWVLVTVVLAFVSWRVLRRASRHQQSVSDVVHRHWFQGRTIELPPGPDGPVSPPAADPPSPTS